MMNIVMKINWYYQYFKYLLRVSRHYLRSDKLYRVMKFRKDFGFYPDLFHPSTFNEKILLRMIRPTNEALITQLVDKLKVREHVIKTRSDILPLIYGVFKTVDDINIHELPEKFVLKCNHDTGSSVICEDKSNFDFEAAKSKLSLHMKMNMYYKTREWQYKEIKPYIFCEEYIERHCLEHCGLIPDIFRFHCFNSMVLYCEVEYTDGKEQYTNIYDKGWNVQNVRINGIPNTPSTMPEPEKFDEAVSIAELLSKGIDYCRVDLYVTSGRIYFSEFTFAPNNGREKFFPAEWDIAFGKNWHLDH